MTGSKLLPGQSAKRKRSVTKTCEPCKLRSSSCSASLPCQQCTELGQAASCHYRGGLRLNALKRSSAARAGGETRPLKATRLNAASETSNTSSPPSANGEDDASQSGKLSQSSNGSTTRDGKRVTFEPAPIYSSPNPLDTLALIAHEASSRTNTNATADSDALGGGVQFGSDSQPPQILFPFFRYFGNTAIAPGIRCVEVEIQDEQTTLMHNHRVTGNASSPESSPSTAMPTQSLLASRTSAADASVTPSVSSSSLIDSTESPAANAQPSSNLFDTENPSLPSHSVLAELLPLFFDRMACHFPFLSEDRIMHEFDQGILEPLEANCIATLACRFAKRPRETLDDRDNLRPTQNTTDEEAYLLAEPFADKAKELVYPLFSLPSLKVCQALVMIMWIEWGSDRDSSAWLWSGLSIRMSQDIGLSYWDTLDSVPDQETKRVHRLTFWAVYFLDRVISYGAGRRVTMAQTDIEIDMPTSTECHGSRSKLVEAGVSHPWPYMMRLLRLRGDISDWLNERAKSDTAREREGAKDALSSFYRSLPLDMRFNVSNLRSHSQNHVAPVLVMMHCMFHSLVCLLYRPSLVEAGSSKYASASSARTGRDAESAQISNQTDGEFAAECSSSSRSISDMLSFSSLMDERTVICNPYMDHAIYIGAMALLDELEHALSEQKRGGTSTRRGDDLAVEIEMLMDKLEVTREALGGLSRYWGGIRWVCKWLEDKIKHVSRLQPASKETGGFYKAAPAKVKADVLRALARLRGNNRLGSINSHLRLREENRASLHLSFVSQIVQGLASERVNAAEPAIRTPAKPTSHASGSEQEGQGDDFSRAWDELESMLSSGGIVLDGIFDFDVPWVDT